MVGTTSVATAAPGSLPARRVSRAPGYVALTSPTRIADTRTVANGGSTNAYNGKTLAAGTSLAITCPPPMPRSATALDRLNVTAVNPTNAGFRGVPGRAVPPLQPPTSISPPVRRWERGDLGLNASQSFTVYYGPAGAGTVDFTADVMGYYEPATTGGRRTTCQSRPPASTTHAPARQTGGRHDPHQRRERQVTVAGAVRRPYPPANGTRLWYSTWPSPTRPRSASCTPTRRVPRHLSWPTRTTPPVRRYPPR